ncbi:MAG: hypothetical protein Athens101410_767 [Parcubacteria group bacterium Athens1014_10]|nr:MAG: hypothetical protein Athens101410_767 [Parcubacteria group bacterium Athens1014_10]TSD04826.1 MAG: hypothetical protein Athens071412_610 [Parcubacteria group bacterium Athens0714_12]
MNPEILSVIEKSTGNHQKVLNGGCDECYNPGDPCECYGESCYCDRSTCDDSK